MNKISKIRIEWHKETANYPSLHVSLEGDRHAMDELVDGLRYVRVGDYYLSCNSFLYSMFAVTDDIVEIGNTGLNLNNQPVKNGGGYGGRTIEIQMFKGSTLNLHGPWSGNSKDINRCLNPDEHIMEIVCDGACWLMTVIDVENLLERVYNGEVRVIWNIAHGFYEITRFIDDIPVNKRDWDDEEFIARTSAYNSL